MFVKICGITNEDDALFAVAMGADAVGFVFAPSTRQIAPQQVYDITRRLPPEILTVGVFRDEHPSRVIDIVNRSGVRAAQLHGHESPDDVKLVMAQVRRVIKAFPAGSPDVARADTFGTEIILVDAATPGSGNMFDWSLADEVPSGPKLILAGGLTPDNVAAASSVRPARRTRSRSKPSSSVPARQRPCNMSGRTRCRTTGQMTNSRPSSTNPLSKSFRKDE
jgi:phosphoribosylanthranilate isomerase